MQKTVLLLIIIILTPIIFVCMVLRISHPVSGKPVGTYIFFNIVYFLVWRSFVLSTIHLFIVSSNWQWLSTFFVSQTDTMVSKSKLVALPGITLLPRRQAIKQITTKKKKISAKGWRGKEVVKWKGLFHFPLGILWLSWTEVVLYQDFLLCPISWARQWKEAGLS